jgi:hypothetical protein
MADALVEIWKKEKVHAATTQEQLPLVHRMNSIFVAIETTKDEKNAVTCLLRRRNICSVLCVATKE